VIDNCAILCLEVCIFCLCSAELTEISQMIFLLISSRIIPNRCLLSRVFCSQNIYPFVVAAHPQEPNQFAVGMSDGSIKVIEPIEPNGRWGVSASSVDNRTTSPSITNNSNSEQLQRWFIYINFSSHLCKIIVNCYVFVPIFWNCVTLYW